MEGSVAEDLEGGGLVEGDLEEEGCKTRNHRFGHCIRRANRRSFCGNVLYDQCLLKKLPYTNK